MKVDTELIARWLVGFNVGDHCAMVMLNRLKAEGDLTDQDIFRLINEEFPPTEDDDDRP